MTIFSFIVPSIYLDKQTKSFFYHRNLKDKDSILLLAEKSTMASKMVAKFNVIANAVWPGIA